MTNRVTISPRELRAISAALSVAASVYDDDARRARESLLTLAPNAGVCRIAEQFDRQAKEARELAERIDAIADHVDTLGRSLEAVAAEAIDEHERARARDPDDDGCTNPGGHVWNRSAGEADEARIAGDVESDNIRCVHCGADGDA